MKRNRYSKLTKIMSLVIVTGVLFFIAINISQNYLLTSSFFTVKAVITTGALKPLLNNDYFALKGKNLFSIDVQHLARDIRLAYPYLSKVKVSRIVPNKIWFDAQERIAVARVKLADKIFLCDAEGAILPFTPLKSDLILITGPDAQAGRIRLGEVYNSEQLKAAIGLLKEIKSARGLSSPSLIRIEVANPDRMSFFLRNGIEVIIGNELVPARLKVLAAVLTDLKTELDQIKYIDLRFQEPAIGKR